MRFRTFLTSTALLLLPLITEGAATVKTDFSKLQPTPEMIQEARKNPNGWVYAIDGNYGPNDTVPPEAIAGAWKVDAAGNIVPGSFQANPKYKAKQSK